MRMIDIPPAWLALFALLAWLQSSYVPTGLGFGGRWAMVLGGVLIVTGLIMTFAALREFRRASTTPIPHRAPSAMVTGGIFRISRNPIYLADVFILLGLILWWNAVPALILVPVFMLVIERRFIRDEEDRLRQAFGSEFETYAAKVRRWL